MDHKTTPNAAALKRVTAAGFESFSFVILSNQGMCPGVNL